VMVESINQRVADGLSVSDAVFDGATSRLRPVLMTAITSALGLIPMLLSNGVGAEIQKPLASVIVGGLVTATFLTPCSRCPSFVDLCSNYSLGCTGSIAEITHDSSESFRSTAFQT